MIQDFKMKTIKISNGELLDRISILELKKLRMEDSFNLAIVEREFLQLNPKCIDLFKTCIEKLNIPVLLTWSGIDILEDTVNRINNSIQALDFDPNRSTVVTP